MNIKTIGALGLAVAGGYLLTREKSITGGGSGSSDSEVAKAIHDCLQITGDQVFTASFAQLDVLVALGYARTSSIYKRAIDLALEEAKKGGGTVYYDGQRGYYSV